MDHNQVILITGGSGLVGTALLRFLSNQGYEQIITPRSREHDLSSWHQTQALFHQMRPDYVFHLSARVGGIGGHKDQAKMYRQNVLINTHVIEAAHRVGVKKIVAMGSGCVYPERLDGLALKESMVWDGLPHASERAYAQAKRAMLAQLEAYEQTFGSEYAFVISGNLYGYNDVFDMHHSHVIPSLVRKFFEAQQTGAAVTVWGDGSAERDFCFSEDAARALYLIMQHQTGAINLGSGEVTSIAQIVRLLSRMTGVKDIIWDQDKPNGQSHRSYDLSRLARCGFAAHYSLAEGLQKTYDWYVKNALVARKTSFSHHVSH